MNAFAQKVNIAKLYFQADKKRIFSAVLLFSVVIGSAWATMVPNTLAGFYFNTGASNSYSTFGNAPTGNYNNENPGSSYNGYYDNSYSGNYYGNYSGSNYYPPANTTITGKDTAVVYGTDPRFNIFYPYSHTQADNQDYYLFDIKNETKNSGYDDPQNADAGDILIFSIYYHNGVSETTAHNTKIKVSIPTNTGTQIISTAYLWADNAVNATQGNPFTETGTVNISSPQKLEYITGSAKWYPDRRDPRSDAPVPFPNGQSGDEVVNQGVNLGDIKGCWEFSGFVNLKVRVSGILYNPDLTIEKTVRNVASDQTDYSESVVARPRQRVSFQLKIRSTGSSIAKNVFVRDLLPDKLSYVYGSTVVGGNSTGDGITTSSGINIGEILVGEMKTITFMADIPNESQFSRGDTALTNTAYARADNVSEKSDIATVVVRNEGCDPNITKPAWR